MQSLNEHERFEGVKRELCAHEKHKTIACRMKDFNEWNGHLPLRLFYEHYLALSHESFINYSAFRKREKFFFYEWTEKCSIEL